LPETLLVDWKMSATLEGEIHTNGKGRFILTTSPCTTQEQSRHNWSSQGSRGWHIRYMILIWPRATSLFFVP
jgi:hypothetical protein